MIGLQLTTGTHRQFQLVEHSLQTLRAVVDVYCRFLRSPSHIHLQIKIAHLHFRTRLMWHLVPVAGSRWLGKGTLESPSLVFEQSPLIPVAVEALRCESTTVTIEGRRNLQVETYFAEGDIHESRCLLQQSDGHLLMAQSHNTGRRVVQSVGRLGCDRGQIVVAQGCREQILGQHGPKTISRTAPRPGLLEDEISDTGKQGIPRLMRHT